VLASASPQRRAILARLHVPFTVRVADVAELEQGEPEVIAVENARRKASAVAGDRDEVVLGCDTVVALGGRIHGKPPDEPSARRTLQALSGRTHAVVSGLVLLLAGVERVAHARTEVRFRELSPQLLDWYLATGEWRGRAGGYAIQGAGAALVRDVAGDYENVVGLPLASLLDLYPELLTGG
jgi:nucleoside triphosphate pyrophosphatase